MDDTYAARDEGGAPDPTASERGSGLLLSVQDMPAVRTRDEVSASDGGGTGRSDTNDKGTG